MKREFFQHVHNETMRLLTKLERYPYLGIYKIKVIILEIKANLHVALSLDIITIVLDLGPRLTVTFHLNLEIFRYAHIMRIQHINATLNHFARSPWSLLNPGPYVLVPSCWNLSKREIL